MLFKLERKKKLNKNIIFLGLSLLVITEFNKSLRSKQIIEVLYSIFNYLIYKVSPLPLIILSVNFGLPGENLVTSTIHCAIRRRRMEERRSM